MELVIFACQHRIPEEWRPPLSPDQLDGCTIRLIQLPCSAKLATVFMLRPFENGADGVLVLACSPDTCRSLEGSRRARMRVLEAKAVLEETGLGAARIMIQQDNGEPRRSFHEAVQRLSLRVQKEGLSPIKGHGSNDNS